MRSIPSSTRLSNTYTDRAASPETYEAAFVTAVWERAQSPEAPLRDELLCRTGVTQDSVKQVREEAADALYEGSSRIVWDSVGNSSFGLELLTHGPM